MSARRRRCEFCEDIFRPDPRLGANQRACGKPGCKEQRKVAARAAWRAAHPDCYRGRAAKHRAYREAKRGERARPAVERDTSTAQVREQDAISAQSIAMPRVIDVLLGVQGEQDAISAQVHVLLGLAASLDGSAAEQDAIARRVAVLDNLGRRVLERVARPARPPQQARLSARGGGPP